LNTYEIWWMVVLIANISFSGYFTMKWAGARKGILLTSIFAGLASSTALSLHFARLAQAHPDLTTYLAAGILIACGTMLPRMVIIASLINPALFPALIGPAIVMAALIYGAVAIHRFRHNKERSTSGTGAVQNPLGIVGRPAFWRILGGNCAINQSLAGISGGCGYLVDGHDFGRGRCRHHHFDSFPIEQ
jgi:uncharacterized membrane protein (DUF4010 family)